MVNPPLNTNIPAQNISANPLGEQKIPVVKPQQALPPSINTVNVPKFNLPAKDTLTLSKKTEQPEQTIKSEKTAPPEPTGLQLKKPMNVGLVKPGIPSSYAEGKTPEPNLDPKMLAQAGIDPSDPQQLAALGLSPEQMKQVATSVTGMAKTGKAGAMAVWQAVGVGFVALSGTFLVATKKGKALAQQGIQWVKDKGIIGDAVKNIEKSWKSGKTQAVSIFSDLTKSNSDVTALFDDAKGTFKNINIHDYVQDLMQISKKRGLSPENFRDIKIDFWKDLSANAPNKDEEVKTALTNIFEVAKKFSAVDGIVPKIKINLSGLSNLDECFPQMIEKAKDLDEVINLLSSDAVEKKSGKTIGKLVESISLTALESGIQTRNPIVINVGNNLFKNERSFWNSFLGSLGF
jgi:hypothetical protein